MNFYAHSLEGEAVEKWQPLAEHLENVAEMAAGFAKIFEGENWAEIAGNNHDLGKGVKDWQAYLRRANKIVDDFATDYDGHPNHAALGAQWLFRHSKTAGKLLAYCVAGHHGGLPNWVDSGRGRYGRRLKEDNDIIFRA